MQAEGDDLAAKFGGGVDGAVAVGEVGFPVAFLDHAAADGRDDRDADAHVLGGLLELGEAGGAEVTGTDPAVREVRVGKAGVLDLGEDLGPGGCRASLMWVPWASVPGNCSRAAVMGQFSAV